MSASLSPLYDTLLVFVCLGGSGSFLRPLRRKLGDSGATELQLVNVGLEGGDGKVISVVVGLHPSCGRYCFSELSLVI